MKQSTSLLSSNQQMFWLYMTNININGKKYINYSVDWNTDLFSPM